ncbi:MAG: hypothetical protein GY953_50795, partial [bacterium]|nr:hypothetical protein [bacterium]
PDNRRRVNIHRAPTLSQLYLGLHRENAPDDVLVIPHCHQPGDWRLSDPGLERLVEIMSMHGTFEWFGRRYLERGYRVGFIAASDDHLGHPGYTGSLAGGLFQRGGLAAVLAPEKTSDSIFTALRELSAYATTGERLILDASVNGTRMGGRADFAEERRVEGRVIGTSPIDSVAVVRNGEEVWRRDYLTQTRPTRFVQVDFHSSAEERFRESPRGWRYWKGTLDVEGAELVSFDTPQFRNRHLEFARRDENRKNRIQFATGTRGKASSIILELRNITGGAAIRIELDGTREIPSTNQEYRPIADIPGAELRLPFANARDGWLRRSFQVDRYTDGVSLRFLETEAPMEREFSFVDRERIERGDYYYVRVKQLDGALAWSSPV